jgi:hypothetical protein
VLVADKPEKGKELTMTDVKAGFSMDMQGIKQRMITDMTPEDRGNIAALPPEEMLSAIMSGQTKSLSAEKKMQYKKEIEDVAAYYDNLSQKVIGRRIGGTPKTQSKKTEETKTPKVEGKPPDPTQYPPAKHKGRSLVDDETGTKWISDGTKWNKVAG